MSENFEQATPPHQKKIVLCGGTGQLGIMLTRHFLAQGHKVVVLGRGASVLSTPTPPWLSPARFMSWDARSIGPWAAELDGADVVFNLAGRNVNCRYTPENRREMMDSRVESTRVVGEAIARADKPPGLWLQMSTATLYAHSFDRPNDEHTGVWGGDEPDAPDSWRFSIEIARAWEAAQNEAKTPATRRVQLRAAMTMSADPGGIFSVLLRLTRAGFGGAVAGGRQMMSWIHEEDFCTAVDWLIAREDADGPFNFAAPHPLPQREFMAALRAAAGIPVGLPAARWMASVGAFLLRTETELLFKSRFVLPARLLEGGFAFRYPTWPEAARDLVARYPRKA